MNGLQYLICSMCQYSDFVGNVIDQVILYLRVYILKHTIIHEMYFLTVLTETGIFLYSAKMQETRRTVNC